MDLSGLLLNLLADQRVGFWEGEKGAVYWCMSYHTFIFSLSFLLSHFLSFFCLPFLFFLLCFYSFFFFFLFLCCCSLCIAKTFLYCLPWLDLPFYPSTAFGLLWVPFLGHPLVCRLLSHHHYLGLAMARSIPRQKGNLFYFSCFS